MATSIYTCIIYVNTLLISIFLLHTILFILNFCCDYINKLHWNEFIWQFWAHTHKHTHTHCGPSSLNKRAMCTQSLQFHIQSHLYLRPEWMGQIEMIRRAYKCLLLFKYAPGLWSFNWTKKKCAADSEKVHYNSIRFWCSFDAQNWNIYGYLWIFISWRNDPLPISDN